MVNKGNIFVSLLYLTGLVKQQNKSNFGLNDPTSRQQQQTIETKAIS